MALSAVVAVVLAFGAVVAVVLLVFVAFIRLAPLEPPLNLLFYEDKLPPTGQYLASKPGCCKICVTAAAAPTTHTFSGFQAESLSTCP